MSSAAEVEVRRNISLHRIARNRFGRAVLEVTRAGARPFSGTPRMPDRSALVRAERAASDEASALNSMSDRAIAAIRDLARERGIDTAGDRPYGVSHAGVIWVVATPDELEEPVLVAIDVDRLAVVH